MGLALHADPTLAEERARLRMERVARLEAEFGPKLNEAGLWLLRRVQFACWCDLNGPRASGDHGDGRRRGG